MNNLAEQQAYWQKYYQAFAGKNIRWLDLSNENVQLQTFCLALEAAGAIYDRRCLDGGCGNGQIALCLNALGASEVTAVDLVEEFVQENRRKNAQIYWLYGDLASEPFCQTLGTFDRIFLLEVLQYLPIQQTIPLLWNHLAPNGRLIGMVPNARCPMAAKTFERFDHHYIPLDPEALKELCEALPQLECWYMRGLSFQEDQRIVPYSTSPWTIEPDWPDPPNRLLFVLVKQYAS